MSLYQKFNISYIIQSEETYDSQVTEERWYVTILSPSVFINQQNE